jgi:hypothetical protein
LDNILLEAARDADILIFDAQFTPEEYEKRRGWGHSTWVQATEVAKKDRRQEACFSSITTRPTATQSSRASSARRARVSRRRISPSKAKRHGIEGLVQQSIGIQAQGFDFPG